MTPTSIVAYLALFATVGFLFLFVALLLGRFLRPHAPGPVKQEIYECGEPAIGSGYVQFDLRFYVIALLFIIFEVEVAFFFPWAVVFGKATQLTDPRLPKAALMLSVADPPTVRLTSGAEQKLRELGVARPTLPKPGAGVVDNAVLLGAAANRLALTAIVDIAVFFAVLLVGFAYVWYRGDLSWVRATRAPSGEQVPEPLEMVSAIGTRL